MKKALVIYIVALSTRLIWVFNTPKDSLHSHELDSFFYIAAKNLIEEGMIYGPSSVLPMNSYASRPPVFVYYYALLHLIFGYENYFYKRIFHAFVISLIAIVVYLIAKKIFDKKTGFIAGLITAVYPHQVFYGGLLQSDGFYTLMVWCFFLFYVYNYKFISGLFMAISLLTRSVFISFVPFALVDALINRKSIIFFLSFFIPVSLWIYRNYKIYKTPVFSIDGGKVFFDMHQPETKPPCSILKIPDEVLNLNDEIKIDRELYKRGLQFIIENPIRFIKEGFIKIYYFFRLKPFEHAHDYTKIKGYISLISSSFLFLTALLGFIISIKYIKKYYIMLIFLISTLAVHFMFHVLMRHRLPVEPFFIILSAYFIRSILPR
ncbi:MAG: glycosyltransferase family 39 protein [bacterium]|nr:glycosyltransferase family 39 protein [bacterium]